MDSTRIKKLLVSACLLVDLFKNGERTFAVAGGLPEDTRIDFVYLDERLQLVVMHLLSDEFEEVPVDGEIPTITPIITTRERQEA